MRKRVQRRFAAVVVVGAVPFVAAGCGSGTAGIAGGMGGGGGGGGPGSPPPVAVLDFSILQNPDERRGIPLTFTVFDAEGDDCFVLLQWRRDGESFPELSGLGVQQLKDLAKDPGSELARELQICSELPHTVGGRIGALPPDRDPETSVRLPELASSAAQLLAKGLEGRVLEILRSSSRPAPLEWADSVLAAPTGVASAPVDTNALVLDEAPGGGWVLREIDLATGALVDDVASGGGVPGPLAAQGEQVAFVAAGSGTVWSVVRVDLQSSATSSIDVPTTGDGIRGIAAINASAALVTVDDALVRVRFSPGAAPSSATVLDGLDEPWGVAVDPLLPERAYVAERGADRVLEVDLGPRRVLPVPAAVAPGEGAALGALPLPAPGAIALERAHRLLVATHPGGVGSTSLRALELRRPTNETGGTVAEPFVEEIASLPGTASDFTTGPDGLRLAALPGVGTLAAGGGVEQRHTIASDEPYSPWDQVVALAPGEVLDPVPPVVAPWRIRASTAGLYESSSTGVEGTYLWNAGADVEGGGLVVVRSIAIDDSVGNENLMPKRLLPGISVETPPITIDVPGVNVQGEGSGLVVDLDGDGDLDLAICYQNSSGPLGHGQGGASVFLQEPGLAFPEAPGSPLLPPHPDRSGNPRTRGIAAGDLDGDGRLDLVLANYGGPNHVAVYLQQGPPGFFVLAEEPGMAAAAGTEKVTCADLDMDGVLEVVTTHSFNGALDTGAVVVWRLTGSSPLTLVPDAPIELGKEGESRPHEVAAADLDGDGDVDLVVADEKANALWILDQDELGGFSVLEPLEAPSGSFGGPRDLIVADLDGDGDLDLAAATSSELTTVSDGLLVFEQIAPGAFEFQQKLGNDFVTASPRSIGAGDLDGDGDFDLVAVNYFTKEVRPFHQVSPASQLLLGMEFVLETSTNPGTSSFGTSATVLADVDGDGDLDVVAANTQSQGISLDFFDNIGPGRYAVDGPPIDGAVTTFGVWGIDVGDIDGDGDVDIASASRFAPGAGPEVPPLGGLGVLLQVTPGAFTVDLDAPYGTEDLAAPRSVRLADVNGDGMLDMLAASPGVSFDKGASFIGASFSVFLHEPQETESNYPAGPTQELLSGTKLGPVFVDVGDFDGDGALDLAGACDGGSEAEPCVVVFRNTGDPALPFDPTPIVLDEAGFQEVMLAPVHVLAVDLDGDGLDDLVVCNDGGPGTGNVVIFRSLGDGAFETMGTPFDVDTPTESAVGDLDGDGDLDIVVSMGNKNSPDLASLFFQSGGAFAPSPQSPLSDLSLSSGQAGLSVAAADLDGDGDLDFAVSVGLDVGNSPDSMSLFLQGRSGVFAADPRGPIALDDDTSPLAPQSLRIADIDGDGDVDIVAANRVGNSISIVYGVH